MKRFFLVICLLGLSMGAKAQTSTEGPHYFAQCMLNIEDQQVFSDLEASLRSNPYVSVARLDWNTHRAFLITKDLTSFSREQFESWLGASASNASCIQVGLHGTDVVNPYPFTNCENE